MCLIELIHFLAFEFKRCGYNKFYWKSSREGHKKKKVLYNAFRITLCYRCGWVLIDLVWNEFLQVCLLFYVYSRCVEVIAKEGQNLKELYLVSCKITDYGM